MIGALAIPRKDARLAGVIVWPWVVVLALAFLVCSIGELVPGVPELLWGYQNTVPSMSQRVFYVAAIASLACYLVPCWVAVVVSLGDRTSHASMLAAAVPVSDARKIGSKLFVLGAVSLVVWLAWLALATIVNSGTALRPSLFAAAAAATGACSGLGAAALLRRSVPAIVMGTLLPLAGVPIAWATTSSFLAVVTLCFNSYYTGGAVGFGEQSCGVSVASALRPMFDWGGIVAGSSLAAILGVCTIPYLAPRDSRRRPLHAVGIAIVGASLVVVACCTVKVLQDPWLAKFRAGWERKIELRDAMLGASDESLVNLALGKFDWGAAPELAFVAHLSPNAGSSGAIKFELSKMAGFSTQDNWESLGLLKAELRRRLADASSQARPILDTYVSDPQTGPMRKLRLASLLDAPENVALAAQVLSESQTEAVHLAALALLASWHPESAYPDSPRYNTLWFNSPNAANEVLRSTLQGHAIGSTNKLSPTEALTNEQRSSIERALKNVNRPHPLIADLLAQNPEWKSSPMLECIRTGQGASKPKQVAPTNGGTQR